MVNPQLIQNLVDRPSSGQSFMDAFTGEKSKRLMGSALRGEPGATEELATFNPQLAMQLQKQMQEARLKEAQRLKTEAETEKVKAQILESKREVFNNFYVNTAKRMEGIDNLEDAQKILAPLERDFYESFKEVHGVDLEPLFGPPGDITEQEFASFKGAEDPDRLPGDFRTYQFKGTDQTVTLNEADPEDQKFLQENRTQLIPAPSRQEVGEEGAFGGDKTLMRGLAESEISTRNAIRQGYQLRDLLMEDPDALTVTARGLGLVQAMAHETEAAARVMGFKIPEGLNDASRYAETFEGLGIDNARARSLLTGLAYTAAAAKMNQTARALSDRDVKNALQILGAGYVTPEARVAVLDMFLEDIAESFKVRRSVIMGPDAEPYRGDLGLRGARGAEQPATAVTTREQWEALPSGTSYIDPNGKKRIKK